ncbi:MAG: hypothetical protein HYV09_23315 [Deltaproteobacteria bacterium]|nr:hypothetical protein [Deltaproteobacteria bacterium]
MQGRVHAERLLVLGGGFTGAAVARLALERAVATVATTRDAARASALEALGARAIDPAAASADADTMVVVTFPPDRDADRALAARVRHARAIVYVSSSVVYGDARGRVSEESAPHALTPRAEARLEAERVWRDVGATIVRSPAIYGPGRGLHLRLARGALRVAGAGDNVVSRVHVDDLAAALLDLALLGPGEDVFVAGDRHPCPHLEVIAWLCEQLGAPLPPHGPAEEADETLRHSRALDPTRLWSTLAREPAYPTYREGFAQCIAVDRGLIAAQRGARSPA